MKRYFLPAALLFLAANVAGQSGPEIKGIVKQGSEPVAGAVVSVVAQAKGASRFTVETDAAGRFSIRAVPGRYLITASHSGGGVTSSQPLRVEVGASGSEVVEISLTLSGPIRETVTIAADELQHVDEVSKTVTVISGREMRERADFSLVESLRSIPGFRIQQLGGFGRTASIKTRGLRNQDTAILLDGVRLRDAAAITGDVSPFLGDITLTSVSRVEVLRGSGSSIYGTNSIGGTVNFITPEPTSRPSGQLSYAGGGLGLHRFRGNFSAATDSEDLGFNVAVSRTAYLKAIDGNDAAHNLNFQNRWLYRPSSRTNISARFFVSDASVELNSNPDTLGSLPSSNATIIDARAGINFTPDQHDPDDSQETKFFNGHVSVDHLISKELVLSAFYSGLKTERLNDSGPLGVGFQSAAISAFEGLIQTANAGLQWTPSGHVLKVGYEFEHEKYGNDGSTPGGEGDFFVRAYQSSNTFFLQDVVTLLDGRLQLAGGIRAQSFRLERPKFSLTGAPYSDVALSAPPSALTVDAAASYYFASSGTKLRAHVGNGFRIPSLYERFGTFFSSFGTPSFFALGDPGLKPETSIAWDAGVDQYLAGGRARLSAVFFYTDLINTIGFGDVVPDIGQTPRPFGGYLDSDGGVARGAEFSAHISPIWGPEIFASYTYTKSRQNTPLVIGSGVFRSFGVPDHQFTLVATQRFGRFWVNFDLLAESSYLTPIFSNSTFSTYVYRFDGNRRGDLTAGYTFRLADERFDIRLFGTIENLFGNEYFENGFRTAGRNARVGVSFGF